nr:hypothetical protein Iba_chr13cCG2480 [Ipomoea batatas]
MPALISRCTSLPNSLTVVFRASNFSLKPRVLFENVSLYLAEAAESLYFMDSEKACNSDELDLWGFSGGDSLSLTEPSPHAAIVGDTLDIDGKTDKDDGGPTVLEDIPEGGRPLPKNSLTGD